MYHFSNVIIGLKIILI